MPPKPVKLLDAALELYDRDIWVVPTNGKGPIWKAWQSERRTRDELIAALDGRDALGIAIVLNQSPWLDVECDSPEAEQALQALFDNRIPPTPTWQSARGLHRLFRRPEGVAERAVVEIEGIEFKIGNGRGACAVVPPSVHDKTGKRRTWLPGLSLKDLEPAELPAEIVERLKAPPPPPQAESTEGERIKEGNRNTTLFAKAAQMKLVGLDEEAITAALLSLNDRLCDPPLPEAEVRKIAHSAATGESQVNSSFVAALLREIDLWHDQNSDPFATLPQGEHRENWLIGARSRSFKRWLTKKFYDATGGMLGSNGVTDICAMLEGRAVFDGPEYFLFRRTGHADGRFYLDLCDEEWRVVEIDAEGWRIVSDPPVKFRRAKAMQALAMPEQTPGTELKDLLIPFLNVREDQWVLVAAWLVAALRPMGPYPILKLLGEQGSAKTTTARVLRALVDPNSAPVRAEPRSTRDLMIASANGWVICLDNLSVIKADLSDALCRLSTGGGFATRTLYTDDEESIFDAMRPVILTSIEEIGTRSDLLERSLIIELPEIPESRRQAEKRFWAEFNRMRPRILGALLDGVSGAIRRLPTFEGRGETDLPRLADFYVWGEAAEESFGFKPGMFAEAFRANQATATCVAVESNPFVSWLMKRLETEPSIEATAADLLQDAEWMTTKTERERHGWPKAPRVVSAILKRVAPNLRAIGITAEQGSRGGGDTKVKVWRIRGPEKPKTTDTAATRPKALVEDLKRKSQGRKTARVAK